MQRDIKRYRDHTVVCRNVGLERGFDSLSLARRRNVKGPFSIAFEIYEQKEFFAHSSRTHFKTLILRVFRFIMAELLETERSYVKDLELAINCFLKPMRANEGNNLPAALQGKETIIFGNVEEILHFHKTTFLKELEKYETMPEDVGHCFVTWVREKTKKFFFRLLSRLAQT